MKKAIIIACAGLICTVAWADDWAQFAPMYKHAEKMFEQKDVNGLYQGLSPNFTETANGQTMNRNQSMAMLKQFLAMFHTIHCRFTGMGAHIKGNMATTMDKAHIWGTMRDPKTHKMHKLDASRNETFTWQKSAGHWMVSSIVATNEKMMMDGKPMPMGSPTSN